MFKNKKANVILDRQFLSDIIQKLEKAADKLGDLLMSLEPCASEQEVRTMDNIETVQRDCIERLKLRLY